MRDMEKKRAWVKYMEQDGREGFAIMVNVNGDWGLDSWFPCVAKEGGNGDTDYIHWTFLRKLEHIQNLGYSIEFD